MAVVPVTTIIIVLIGVLLNSGTMNRRYDDLKDLIKAYAERQDANQSRVEETLKANLIRLEETTHSNFTRLEETTKSNLTRLEETTKSNLTRLEETTKSNLTRVEETVNTNLHRVEDALLGKFAELDTRLSRIEHHLNLS